MLPGLGLIYNVTRRMRGNTYIVYGESVK